MPAPTDHAVRRREVARAAVRSIARGGVEGATLRAVADEGGWSVGVVQHYFRSKSQLLTAAVRFMAERHWSVLTEHTPGSTALDRLHRALSELFPPNGHDGPTAWRVWVCFWAQATNDPRLAEAVEDQTRRSRDLLASTIRAGQEDGSIRPELSPEIEAAYLSAAVQGLGVTSTVDPGAAVVPGAVDRLLEPLRCVASKDAVGSSNGRGK